MLDLRDIPITREAPSELAAGLCEIDPRLFAVGLSRDRWLIAYRSDDSGHLHRGRRLLENTKRALEQILAKHPGLNARMIPRLRDRMIVASVKALGVTGVKIYRSQYPHSALIAQVRADDFYQRHVTESQFWRDYDAIEEKEKAEREAELTDPGRAYDAWRYAFTVSHSVTNHNLTPHRSSVRHVVKTI